MKGLFVFALLVAAVSGQGDEFCCSGRGSCGPQPWAPMSSCGDGEVCCSTTGAQQPGFYVCCQEFTEICTNFGDNTQDNQCAPAPPTPAVGPTAPPPTPPTPAPPTAAGPPTAPPTVAGTCRSTGGNPIMYPPPMSSKRSCPCPFGSHCETNGMDSFCCANVAGNKQCGERGNCGDCTAAGCQWDSNLHCVEACVNPVDCISTQATCPNQLTGTCWNRCNAKGWGTVQQQRNYNPFFTFGAQNKATMCHCNAASADLRCGDWAFYCKDCLM